MIPDVFTFDVYVVVQTELLNDPEKPSKYNRLVFPSLSGFTYNLMTATKYCRQFERFDMTIIPVTCTILTETILHHLNITYEELISKHISSFSTKMDEITVRFINYNPEIRNMIVEDCFDAFEVTDRLYPVTIHPNTSMECVIIHNERQETAFQEMCNYRDAYLDDIIENIIPNIHNLMLLSNYAKDRHFQLFLLYLIKYRLLMLMILQRSKGIIPNYLGGSDEIASEKVIEVLNRMSDKTLVSYENSEFYDFIDIDYFVYFMTCINNLNDYDWGQLYDE